MKNSFTPSGLVLGLLAALLTVPVSVALAPAAMAAPAAELEPNDTIFQTTVTANVEGLSGTTNVSGDVDYFWLGLRPQRQIRLYAARTGCDTSYDTIVSVGGLDTLYLDDVDSGTLTTPGVIGGPTQYFRVAVWGQWDGAVGCNYQLQIQGSTGGTTDAVDPNPPTQLPVVPLAEPDDLESQATGPLVGDTSYEGVIDTSNDVDNLFFDLKAAAAANVTLSVANGSVDVDSSTSSLSDLAASAGESDTESTDTASYDRTFRLAITGSTGSRYRITVSPPSSLGTTVTAPPPPSTGGGGSGAGNKKVRKVVLKAGPRVVRKWGYVRLKGKLKPGRSGKVVIWQKTRGASRGWHVESRTRANSRGRFSHSESIHGGSRWYRACFRSKCSKPVFVRML